MDRYNIYDYSREALEELLISLGEKKFRATQIYEALYKEGKKSFDEITTLSKASKEFLKTKFDFSDLEIKEIKVSSDETTKFLFSLSDKNLIETVLMPHDYGYSVCVTTQVGCNMGCKFCASGELKKIRNLKAHEIVLQVLKVNEYLKEKGARVSHVVVMGIGEPFDNFENVMEFLKIINDNKGLEIGSRHITLSTCGLVERIKEFSDFPLQVNLAISLHFATDEKRSKYMPINRKYNLSELFDSINYYYLKTNRRVTFEYILLDGINDTISDAKDLVKLVRSVNCYLNLIPYNETNGIFRRSSELARDQFFDYLMKNKINAVVRREYGHDIDAACGQLRAKAIKKVEWTWKNKTDWLSKQSVVSTLFYKIIKNIYANHVAFFAIKGWLLRLVIMLNLMIQQSLK